MKKHNFFLIQASTWYGYYLVFTHIFALMCVFLIAPWYLSILFLLFIVISFPYYFFHDEEMMMLQHDKKTQWILELSDGERVRAELLPSSVMMRYFLVLHFQCVNSNKKKRITLFSDSFSKTDFQALRRCVKMGYL